MSRSQGCPMKAWPENCPTKNSTETRRRNSRRNQLCPSIESTATLTVFPSPYRPKAFVKGIEERPKLESLEIVFDGDRRGDRDRKSPLFAAGARHVSRGRLRHRRRGAL